MERIKLFSLLLIISGCVLPVFAEDAGQRVIPSVKAVNLAPIETKTPEIKAVNLSKPGSVQENIPANIVPVKVQAVPADTKEEPVKVQAVPVKEENNTAPKTFASQETAKSQPSKGGAAYQPPVQLVAPNGQAVNSLTTPADIESDACVKIFQLNAEDLLVYTLAALEANNFNIGEIQSRGGYITFKAANKDFLAVVSEIDSKNSMLKITPANGVYHFAPGIVYKVFEYITIKMK